MNLLKETVEKLKYHGHAPEDVLWVGVYDGSETTNWEDFAIMADRVYDSGYGMVVVREELVIVGKDWWLERHEYDGSEWWEYKTLPKRQNGAKALYKVFEYEAS